METDPLLGVKPAGHAAHHIIGGNIVDPRKCVNPATPTVNFCEEARNIFDLAGLKDINAASNGVYLPATSSVTSTALTVHSVVHTRAYFEAVYERMKNLKVTGVGDQAAVVAELEAIRKELTAGTFTY